MHFLYNFIAFNNKKKVKMTFDHDDNMRAANVTARMPQLA